MDSKAAAPTSHPSGMTGGGAGGVAGGLAAMGEERRAMVIRALKERAKYMSAVSSFLPTLGGNERSERTQHGSAVFPGLSKDPDLCPYQVIGYLNVTFINGYSF